MKKATIPHIERYDQRATKYLNADRGDTIMEVGVNTTANINDRVRLPQLGAERTVINSRWLDGYEILQFTANEWMYLRGLNECTPDVLSDAREAMPKNSTAEAPTGLRK